MTETTVRGRGISAGWFILRVGQRRSATACGASAIIINDAVQLIAQEGNNKVWFEEVEVGAEFRPPFGGQPFVAMLIVNQPHVPAAYRDELSIALVRAGCRYALCTGHDQEAWHTSLDLAQVHGHSGDEHVMTTSHPDETLPEVVEFFLNWAYFEGLQRDRFLVLFVGKDPATKEEIVKSVTAQLTA